MEKKSYTSSGIKYISYLLFFTLFFTILFADGEVSARKQRKIHIVQKGESIASIADFYGVSQRDLCEMNKISTKKPLRLGQKLKIPNVLRISGKTYTVKQGDSLSSIAAHYKRTPKDIAHANKISVTTPLQAGRVLLIPDKNSNATVISPKGKKLEPILFLRVRMGDRARLKLYHDNGKINKTSVQKLSYLARDKHGDKVKRLNFRLVKMIQLVSEKFPDKAIEIISGYRSQAGGNESQHAFGRALDFRIKGVSGKSIWNFCKTIKNSGCGYYPNGGFVHMDAREKNASWVDTSR
ncbi:MAG: LysM peptidoglycan-binding domain-containing protein [Deltaproteobacteria bacterium]|nr:LysM peptidoglycan-binding domain-containing protein [Deltaproteobacteria bacterium]